MSNNKQQKPQQEDDSEMMESLVGDRQYVYFQNNDNDPLPQEIEQPMDQNHSIAGTVQKVYFQNASTVNRTEYAKDNELYEEINAFKPSSKIQTEKVVPSSSSNNKKVKSHHLNSTTSNIPPEEEEDDNEFLDLNHVGKWQKVNQNKSTVVSEEMKKMNNHLENRLTQTKWNSKRKIPEGHDELKKTGGSSGAAVKSEKNPSIVGSVKNDNENESKVSIRHNLKKQGQGQGSTDNRFKKGTEKYMTGLSEKQQITSMTSWKKQEQAEQQENQQQQKQSSEESPSEEEESSEEQQSSEEESSEQQEEESSQSEQNEDQDEQEKSSGDEGWDEPQEPQEQEEESEKQDPLTMPQPQQPEQTKVSKWNKTHTSTNRSPSNTDNFRQQSKKVRANEQKETEEDIQDLTEGDNEDMQIDEEWEGIEKILLRIQKLVN